MTRPIPTARTRAASTANRGPDTATAMTAHTAAIATHGSAGANPSHGHRATNKESFESSHTTRSLSPGGELAGNGTGIGATVGCRHHVEWGRSARGHRLMEVGVMTRLIVRHPVEDYARWRRGYDEHEDLRDEMGVQADTVFREVGDGNDLTVTHDFASADAARAFVGDPRLAAAMKEIGVSGEPEIWIVDEA